MKILLLLFIVLSLQDITKPNVTDGEYPSKNYLTADVMQLRWITTNTTIEFALVVMTQGWVGIGWNSDGGMTNMDCAMGYIDANGNVVVADKWSTGEVAPSPDSYFGGTDDILGKNGQKVNGVTTIKFIRPLISSDKFDRNIVAGWNTVYLAYATDTGSLSQHVYKTAFRVDFFKGKSSLLTFGPLFNFQYIVLAVVFILVVIFSFISTYFHTVPPFDILLHYRALPPVINEKIGRYVNFIPDLTIGEYLIFCSYLIIVIFWCFVSGVNIYYYNISPTNVISRVFAQLTLLNFAFLLLPAARNSIWVYIFGISFERASKYHAKFGILTIFYVFMHMLFMFIDQGVEIPSIFTLDYTTAIGGNFGFQVFGFVSFCLMLVLLIMAIGVQPFTHDLFVVTHRILAALVIVFASLHHYYVLIFLAFSLILLSIDHIIRWIKIANPTKLISAKTVNNITRLEMSHPLIKNFRPGSYIYIWVPGVTPFEWHPFSISSSPTNEKFTLHIQSQNTSLSWTRNLKEYLEKNQDHQNIFLRVEGPYGNPSIRYDDYQTLILISGGIGVTPMISLASYLDEKMSTLKKLKNVIFVWTLRDTEILELFKDQLLQLKNNPNIDLMIHSTSGNTSNQTDFEIYEGRPNLEKLFEKQEGKYIGVMACGPETLLNTIQYLIWKNSTQKQFHFHKEVFKIV